MDHLKTIFHKLHPEVTAEITPNSVFTKYSAITLSGKTIGCSSSSKKTPSIALSEWDSNLYGTPPSEVVEPAHPSSKFRPVKIHFFAKASFSVGEQVKYLVVAAVSWFRPHPSQHLLGKPAEVWCHENFERPGVHSYVPIEKIGNRCAHCTRTIEGDPVVIIVPLVY